jgi:hypothetical protein
MEIVIAGLFVGAVLGFVYHMVRRNRKEAELRNQEVVPAVPGGLETTVPEVRDEVKTPVVPAEVVGDVVELPVEAKVEVPVEEPVKKVRKAKTVKVTSTKKPKKKTRRV